MYLLTLSEVNVVDAETGTRPYPDFGQVSWRGNKDTSSYQGFSAAVKRSFSRGFLFSANYMWSHEIDDGSNGSGDGDSLVPQNVACPAMRARQRHLGCASRVECQCYLSTAIRAEQAVSEPTWSSESRLLGSWELTSTHLARTGFPVNVLVNRSSASVPDGNSTDQRPDLVPGVSLTPPGGKSIGDWINPAAFAVPAPGTFGDAPRNIARGPGAWQIDLGVAKQIPL